LAEESIGAGDGI